MRRIIFLILTIPILLTDVYTQVSQVWVSRYDGNCNNVDNPEAIALDPQGNIYVTGWTYICLQNYNYGTVKYNSAGVQQWAKNFNGPSGNYDYAYAIAVDTLGNSYVTGYAITSELTGHLCHYIQQPVHSSQCLFIMAPVTVPMRALIVTKSDLYMLPATVQAREQGMIW
jgi:hypothetical protein